MQDLRKEEQRKFFNKWRTEVSGTTKEREEKASSLKYYSIVDSWDKVIAEWFIKNARDKRVLDYGCGRGEASRSIARCGVGEVVGIDISEVSVAIAEKETRAAGLQDRCAFFAMDAENMTFDDNSFDIVYCSGILHHIDMNKAYPEIARILKPSGQLLCTEPLAYNPIIQWYRKRTPHLRTAWEIEHILKKKDVYLGKKYFNRLNIIGFFYLFTIAAVPFRNIPLFKLLRGILGLLDKCVLHIPFIQWLAWQIVFVLSEPKK